MHEPVFDPERLASALRLAEAIYVRHEGGAPYAEELSQLATVTAQELTKADVHGAFGSIASEDWARELLLDSQPVPGPLSREELVAMVAEVTAASTPEWLSRWYLQCLEHATGCDQIIDLIYYPHDVLGPDAPDNLAPEQVVEEAFRRPRRVIVTPPPTDGH